MDNIIDAPRASLGGIPSPPVRYDISHAQATLYHGDIRDTEIAPNSLDIILTDPPYPKEFLHCWDALATFAQRTLKPGGHLFAMSGHVWLPQVLAALDTATDLRYNWMLSMGPLNEGAHTNIGRRIVRSTWKPILWYIKPPSSIHEQLSDNIRVGRKDKRYHFWGQGAGSFEFILGSLKRPKPYVVCDPFLGGGTTAILCAQLGIPFIGCDIDAQCIATTTERLNTLQLTLPMEGGTDAATDSRDVIAI